MTSITEKSYISVGVLTALAGCLFWVGALGGQVKVNTDEIAKLRSDGEKVQDQYVKILVGIARIETELQKLKK